MEENEISLNSTLSEGGWAKVLIAQPKTELDDENSHYYSSVPNENLETFIKVILSKAKEGMVDLVVFPELSIPNVYYSIIKNWTKENKNCIVIAGSNYYTDKNNDTYHLANIFFGDKNYSLEKNILSPIEKPISPSCILKQGNHFNYFTDTPLGKMGILICSDAFDENYLMKFKKLDFICLIACQSYADAHHKILERMVTYNRIDAVYCNLQSKSNNSGRSAFFGKDYKDRFTRRIEKGYTKDDNISFRQVEMPNEAGCLIVSFNTSIKYVEESHFNFSPNRSRVIANEPFIYKNGELIKIELTKSKSNLKKSVSGNSNISEIKNSFNDVYVIEPEDFEKLKLSDEGTLKKVGVNYYLNFNNSSKSLKTVVANDLYIAPKTNHSFYIGNKERVGEISDIIDDLKIDDLILIKILAIGGVGKSTLMWHNIKLLSVLHTVLYLEKINIDELRVFLNEYQSNKKLVIFIDDAVSTEFNKENLVEVGKLLSEYSCLIPICLIIVERKYRYNQFSEKRDFERNFLSLSNFLINYSNENIREEVFRNVVNILFDKSNLSSKKVSDYRKIYEELESESLVDRCFNFLIKVKKDHNDINYTFDWEDWDKVASGENKKFKSIYKEVAFFYQYGVRVPMSYFLEKYNTIEDYDNLKRVISSFEEGFSPVVSTTLNNGEEALALRHEKMGEWYFFIIDNGKDIANKFFSEFINNINSRSKSYLFRNIIRKNNEFSLSSFFATISKEKICNVIESYLSNFDASNYSEEEHKMLMEMHYALINMGKIDESLIPLERSIELKKDNYHALNRLARLISTTDRERAISLFKESLKYDKKNLITRFQLIFICSEKEHKLIDELSFEIRSSGIKNYKSAKIIVDFLTRSISNYDLVKNIVNLKELYQSHNSLGNSIVQLLIIYKNYEDSTFILNDLSKSEKSNKYRIAYLALENHQSQIGITNKNSLEIANSIIQSYYAENNDFYVLLLKARLAQYRNQIELAAKFYTQILDECTSINHFFEVLNFYFKFSDYNFRNRNYQLSIDGIKFCIEEITKKLNNSEFDKLSLRVELILYYNKAINQIKSFKFNRYIKEIYQENQEYKNLIIQNALKLIHDLLIEIENLGLKNLYTEFTKHQISRYYNFASIYFDNLLTERIEELKYIESIEIEDNPSLVNNDEKFLLYSNELKKILTKAIAIDSSNPYFINALVKLKVTSNDSDLRDYIQNIDFNAYEVKHKIKLCSILSNYDRLDLSVSLLSKFGEMDSTDIRLKNDLVESYIKCSMWSHAIRVFNRTDIDFQGKSFKLLTDLAFDIPATDLGRINSRIEFSRFILSMLKPETNDSILKTNALKKNLCFLYFLIDSDMAYKFYKKYGIGFHNSFLRENSNRSYILLTQEWINDFTKFMSRQYFNKYMSDLEVQNVIDNLLNHLGLFMQYNLDYNSISVYKSNEDNLEEKVRYSMDLIISKFSELLLIKKGDFKCVQSFFVKNFRKNDLFARMLTNKIIYKDYESVIYMWDNLLREFCRFLDGKHSFSTRKSSDLYRRVAKWCFLRKDFIKANKLVLNAIKIANNEENSMNLSFGLIVQCEFKLTNTEWMRNLTSKQIKARLYIIKSEIEKAKALNPDLKIEKLSRIVKLLLVKLNKEV